MRRLEMLLIESVKPSSGGNKSIVSVFCVILLLTVGVVMIGVISCAKPVPAYNEVNFSLPPNGIHRINIYCEQGQLIEYSWKADNFIASWYITPGGIPKLAGGHDESIIPPVNGNGVNEEASGFARREGDSRTIELKGDYNGPGYYTLCFYNSERNPSVSVTFRYRVRQE
jgi:hypothetical protein